MAVLKEFCSVAKFTHESPASVHPKPFGVCPRTVRKWVDRYRAKALRDCTIDHPGRIASSGGRGDRAAPTTLDRQANQRRDGRLLARFYVRRDVPMLQQIPPSFFSSGRRISSGSSDGSTGVCLADPSGQQTLVLLFNPFKPNNPAI